MSLDEANAYLIGEYTEEVNMDRDAKLNELWDVCYKAGVASNSAWVDLEKAQRVYDMSEIALAGARDAYREEFWKHGNRKD